MESNETDGECRANKSDYEANWMDLFLRSETDHLATF